MRNPKEIGTRNDSPVSEYPRDQEREIRLINDLNSSDRSTIKRAIVALAHSDSTWLTSVLKRLVFEEDEDLAETAIDGLREISSREATKAIAKGLLSNSPRVRKWAAFTIGEIALSGRHEEGTAVIDNLIEALQNPHECPQVLDEIVHSLCKIGGQESLCESLRITRSDRIPAEVKARTLYSASKFFDEELRDKFVLDTLSIVQTWPIDTLSEVSKNQLFEDLPDILQKSIRKRLDEEGVAKHYPFSESISRSATGKSTHSESLFSGGDSMISILFLAADPSDASRLRLGEELREIQEKLQLAKLRERFELHQRTSVRSADISQALLDVRPQIVHFSGHGTSDGALFFENQTGQIHFVQADALANLFEQFANEVDCVLLNACFSELHAEAIAEHIEYVIGMNEAIGDKTAIAFAIGFYQALGGGRTIEDAYKLGCAQIRLQGISEHLTPVLIKKQAQS